MRWLLLGLVLALVLCVAGVCASTSQNTKRVSDCSAQGGHMVKRRGDDLGRHDCLLPDGRRYRENP